MKKQFKTLAGMAVCILGALATSSCSKDEFFGLEDSEVLDYSTKTEIALSQEYADYMIACFNLVETMKQPVDTTEMKIEGVVNNKPVYYKEGSSPVMDLLNNLKKAYPELEKADKMDLDEIQSIALSKNDALKDIALKIGFKDTKSNPYDPYYPYHHGGGFLKSHYFHDDLFGDSDGWWIYDHISELAAVSDVIWNCSENGFSNNGGIIFDDNSAVSMFNFAGSEWWPTSIYYYNGDRGEADFIVAPSAYFDTIELWDIANSLGPGYNACGRTHYVYDEEFHHRAYVY